MSNEEILNMMEDYPESIGVVVKKNRNTGMTALFYDSIAFPLNKGRWVGVQTTKEELSYIENIVTVIKERFGINASYEKIYQTKLQPIEPLIEKKFIGWKIFVEPKQIDNDKKEQP